MVFLDHWCFYYATEKTRMDLELQEKEARIAGVDDYIYYRPERKMRASLL